MKRTMKKTALPVMLVALMSMPAAPVKADAELDQLRAVIVDKWGELEPEQITPSTMEGWYAIDLGQGRLNYVSSDLKYLLRGELIDLDAEFAVNERQYFEAQTSLRKPNPAELAFWRARKLAMARSLRLYPSETETTLDPHESFGSNPYLPDWYQELPAQQRAIVWTAGPIPEWSMAASSFPIPYANSRMLFYVSNDANFAFLGEILNLDDNTNLTATDRNRITAEGRAYMQNNLSDLRPEQLVVYSPERRRTFITVFTDVNCGFCKKLHNDMDVLMSAGIEVRYIAYPAKPGSAGIMARIWCSPNRKRELTAAKNDLNFDGFYCDEQSQEKQDELTRLGIVKSSLPSRSWPPPSLLQGTPMIVLRSGWIISGYSSAEDLIARIGQLGG
ncbi:MAG: disulfide isomerase DsbC N-terminal domain-containing protein [Pseudomonadota bacterium]